MKAAALGLACLLAGCATIPSPSNASRIGHVHLESEHAHGKLVVGWLTAEQAARWAQHDIRAQDLVDLFARFVVDGPADIAQKPLRFRFDAPRDAQLYAVLDPGRQFWKTVLGNGAGAIGFSAVGGSDLTLHMQTSRPPRACEGPRMRDLVVTDEAVRGAIGNDPARHFCVYLPKSYDSAPARRYPVAYLLPGFGGGAMSYLRGRDSLAAAADRIAAASGREIILVGVDTSTESGATYFVDSPLSGRFDRFFTEAALPAIDRALRTIPQREARALLGHSTGGFNAVSLGLRHSELFSVIGASSPDALDLDRWLFDDHGVVRPQWLGWTRIEAAVGPPGQMWSYAADWSPRDNGPEWTPEWPIDLTTGKPTPALGRWRAQSPIHLIDRPGMREALAKLSGRISIAVGGRDEFGLMPPARSFVEKLRSLGVDVKLDVDEAAGHFERSSERLARALAFALERLSSPTP